jgi:porphobilinogen synthase
MRRKAALRGLVDMAPPGPEKFIWPVFVVDGQGRREPIEAMPGQCRLSTDELLRDLGPVAESGVGGVLLFGVAGDAPKDECGTPAADEGGTVQEATRAIAREFPELVLMTDVCLCAYTEHGHCGPLDPEGNVGNDAALEMLAKVALSHAEAGADVVAPSAMMDGQVMAIRSALDEADFGDTIIMSYSTKFASAMYGPFRQAEQSAPQSGDRQGYQASYADLNAALRESELDIDEGADILMVKPSLLYMDVVCRLRERTDLPLAVYNVSGEYSMLIAAADRGWGDLSAMVRESLIGLKRAGADIFLSYWANRYDEIFGEDA